MCNVTITVLRSVLAPSCKCTLLPVLVKGYMAVTHDHVTLELLVVTHDHVTLELLVVIMRTSLAADIKRAYHVVHLLLGTWR